MTDPEKTIPPAEHHRLAEGRFDRLWSAVGSSPWTLGAFVMWTIACLAFGFWAGLKP